MDKIQTPSDPIVLDLHGLTEIQKDIVKLNWKPIQTFCVKLKNGFLFSCEDATSSLFCHSLEYGGHIPREFSR